MTLGTTHIAPSATLGLARASAVFGLLLAFICAAILVSGCGAPGEPAERKAPIPVSIADLAAMQSGNDVVLTFTLPKESVEHKPLKHLPAVEIYRAFGPVSPAVAHAPSPLADASSPAVISVPAGFDLIITIPSQMVGQLASRNQFRYVDTLSAEDFSHNPSGNVTYLIRTRTSPKKVSADSNFAALTVHPAPDPISDLKVDLARDAIVLTWTPPQKTLVGAMPSIANFAIYRKESDIAGTKSPETPAPLGPPANPAAKGPVFVHIADVAAPPYRDTRVEFGKSYVYSVRSEVQYGAAHVDSADSNLVTVVRRDTFPPLTPEGLILALIPAQGSTPAYFDLSWSISSDNDIAGYNIYRTEGPGTSKSKLNPVLLLTPAFRDMNVLPGRHYLYTVTAVNRAGNESAESAPVAGEVPESGAPAENQPQ
jgi:hypothetical protein